MLRELPDSVTQEEMEDVVRGLSTDDAIDGLLVQLPLPPHLNEEAIIDVSTFDTRADAVYSRLFMPNLVVAVVRGNMLQFMSTSCEALDTLYQLAMALKGSKTLLCMSFAARILGASCCKRSTLIIGKTLTQAAICALVGPRPCEGRGRLPPAERGAAADARRRAGVRAVHGAGLHAAAAAQRH